MVWFGLLLVKLVGTATSVFPSPCAVLRKKGSMGTAVMNLWFAIYSEKETTTFYQTKSSKTDTEIFSVTKFSETETETLKKAKVSNPRSLNPIWPSLFWCIRDLGGWAHCAF